jgi:hypothetical protein
MKQVLVESYIVRIYRRDKNDPARIVGTVEKVGVEGTKSFENCDRLGTILAAAEQQWGAGEKTAQENLE